MSANRASTPPADHATHDPGLIAALSTRDPDLTADDRASAEALLAACTECARLHADLIALATALPNAATPRRIRDYTLTAADAERLRQRGLRGWLARIGSSRDGLTRPLAIGFTTLGLAGLLAATIPTVLPLGAGGGAAPSDAARELAAPASAAASADSLAMSAAPSPADDGEVFNGTDSSDPAPAATPNVGDTAALPTEEIAVREDASGVSTLAVIAGSLVIIGLSLFALRWSARRLGDG
jgi:anti-sigma factor RsiW